MQKVLRLKESNADICTLNRSSRRYSGMLQSFILVLYREDVRVTWGVREDFEAPRRQVEYKSSGQELKVF
jgi:hypothetical protein